MGKQGSLAEWSKALALGASLKGRGFKSRSCHFWCYIALVRFSLLVFVLDRVIKAAGQP